MAKGFPIPSLSSTALHFCTSGCAAIRSSAPIESKLHTESLSQWIGRFSNRMPEDFKIHFRMAIAVSFSFSKSDEFVERARDDGRQPSLGLPIPGGNECTE
jgi:hypothetical protein